MGPRYDHVNDRQELSQQPWSQAYGIRKRGSNERRRHDSLWRIIVRSESFLKSDGQEGRPQVQPSARYSFLPRDSSLEDREHDQIVSHRALSPQPECFVCCDIHQLQSRLTASPIAVPFVEVIDATSEGCSICAMTIMGIATFQQNLSCDSYYACKPFGHDMIEFSCPQRKCFIVQVTSSSRSSGRSSKISLDFFTTTDPAILLGLENGVNLPRTLAVGYTVARIKKWASHCELNHKDCRIPSHPALPTRVLDLEGSDVSNEIRILTTNGLAAPYIALSYCWGDAASMIKLTSVSIGVWENELPWRILPVLFKHAILLTRALGIRYLWIDALCILQDNQQDWERESMNMANVYSNSYLTIAATGSPNSHTGLFEERCTRGPTISSSSGDSIAQRLSIESLALEGFQYRTDLYVRPHLHTAHDRFRDTDNAENHIEDAPLLTRAWAFQERLLPARTLHFHAEELVWECKSGVSCECGELDNEKFHGNTTEKSVELGWLKKNLAVVSRPDANPKTLGYVWLDIVSEFSRLRLTKESDRMPALSGLANSLSSQKLGAFLAGIWEADLARGLIFERTKNPNTNTKLVDQDLTTIKRSRPSWSWASLPSDRFGSVSFDSVLRYGFTEDHNFSILEVSSTPEGSNSFSWVSNATLQVRGLLVETTLESSPFAPMYASVANISFSEPYTARFANDGHVILEKEEKLFCLLVGSSPENAASGRPKLYYALVLRKCEHSGSDFYRAGLLKMESKSWFSTGKVTSCVLS